MQLDHWRQIHQALDIAVDSFIAALIALSGAKELVSADIAFGMEM